MEGSLSMPPDRGAILGRAQWKLRYVRIGKPPALQDQPGTTRLQKSRFTISGGNLPSADSAALTVYRSKDDSEPLHMHAISLVHECQIQMLAHRKQPPEPTLVISFLPDPALDRARKRRSSRTAGLGSSKDSGPPTLWFRAGPVVVADGDGQSQSQLQSSQPTPAQLLQQAPTSASASTSTPTLYEWMRFIQHLVQPTFPDGLPMTPMSPAMSPATPVSPAFINPFAPRQRGPSDPNRPRPVSRNSARTAAAQQYYKVSSVSQATYATVPAPTAGRERPVTFSAPDSPSLHSKCSDLSSRASSMNPQPSALPAQPHHHHQQHQPSTASVILGGFHHINTAMGTGPRPGSAGGRPAKFPADLPSPASTDQGEWNDSWIPSHGRRPSALGSAQSARAGRDSIGSDAAPASPPTATLSSSALPSPVTAAPTGAYPKPRETILDRAFQLRCIPGAERETPGEEKLSSLVRFEALMAEMDEKRKYKAREADQARARAATARENAKRVQAAAAAAQESNRIHRRRPYGSMDSSLRSVWSLDADSSTDSASLDEGAGAEDVLDDSGDGHDEESSDAASLNLLDRALEEQLPGMISPAAQRALEFIAGRRPSHTRPPSSLSFTHEALPIHPQPSIAARPQTSRAYSGSLSGRQYQSQVQLQLRQQQQHQYQQQYGGSRPGMAGQRTLSQPQLAGALRVATTSPPLPPLASGALPIPVGEDGSRTAITPSQQFPQPAPAPPALQPSRTTGATSVADQATEKRTSNSLAEFAKRLSGTSNAQSTQDSTPNTRTGAERAAPLQEQAVGRGLEQGSGGGGGGGGGGGNGGLQAWARSSRARHGQRRRQAPLDKHLPPSPGVDNSDRDFGANEGRFI